MAVKMGYDLSCPGVEYPGRQKAADIIVELQRQAQCYRDYIVPTSEMRLVVNDGGIELSFHGHSGGIVRLPMSHRALLQLYSWLGLPINSRLYKRLVTGYEGTPGAERERFWVTLCNLVNDHFKILDAKRMIRTLKRPDDVWYVRAILSAKYRIIPNDQLFMAVADKLKDVGAEIWDARLSEDIFYLYAVAPGITAQVRADRTFEGDRWIGDEGDAVNAAFMIKNSETGTGGCEVCPAVVTSVDRAYMVRQTSLTLRHLGAEHEVDDMLSDDTIREMNQLVYKQVRDYCASTFDPDRFQEIVDKMNDATQDELEDPVKAAEAARIVFDLTEEREKSILKWLMDSGDKSRFGLAQAVAREAGNNQSLRPDDAAKLEQASADLIENYTSLKLAKVCKSKAEKAATKAAVKAEERKRAVKRVSSMVGDTVSVGDLDF